MRTGVLVTTLGKYSAEIAATILSLLVFGVVSVFVNPKVGLFLALVMWPAIYFVERRARQHKVKSMLSDG